jgi:HPt (histidine-containing phosphotransfer) domain-containing protein
MNLKSPTIDYSYLEGMLKLAKGNPRFVSESVRRFLINAPKTIREIQAFKLDHNRDVLKTKAHKFISACSVVGAMRMINVCYKLSSKAKTEDEVVLRQWLSQLSDEFEMASESLNDYLSKIMADV